MEQLIAAVPRTGVLATDAIALLRHNGRDGVAAHVTQVAAEAERIARRLHADVTAATTAAWLHDISLIVPATEMLAAAESAGLEVLPEERLVPVLLHGKLSAVIAERCFGVQGVAALDAMRCHTTLRAGATLTDKILFVADKLSWDPAHAPCRAELAAALDQSLDEAVAFFLRWTRARRVNMPTIHPWLKAAAASLPPAATT